MRLLILVIMVIPAASFGSEWVYKSDVDAFTDSETHTASVAASGGDGFAVVRCADGSFEMFFSVGEFIGSDDRYSVRHRIDKQPPGSAKWWVSTTGTSVFAGSVDGQRLARSMMSGSTLLLEVTDYQGTPHMANYSLAGSKAALQKVLNACDVPLVEYQADTSGITPAVVEHIDGLGPKSIQCMKQYLVVLGYEVEDMSARRTRQCYEMADQYYRAKRSECPDSGFSSEPHCISEGLTFLALYSDAADRDESLRATCGQLTGNP